MSPAKTAEPIEMQFGIWTWVCPRKHVLGGGVNWRNLANTIEPFMCAGEEACMLSDYFDRLLVHGQVTIIFVVSVGLSVCLCRVFLSHL